MTGQRPASMADSSRRACKSTGCGRGRGGALAAIIDDRLGESGGTVQGLHQTWRQTLHLGVVERCHLIADKQLRRGQDVSEIVIDLGDTEAEIGKVPALPQHGEQIRFPCR